MPIPTSVNTYTNSIGNSLFSFYRGGFDYLIDNRNTLSIFGNIVKGEFENNISPDEKIKLLYRIDIVSMLIFIFTAVLTLLI